MLALTAQERELLRKLGALGGKASAAKMTPEELKARATKASKAAAKKRMAAKRAVDVTSRGEAA